MARPVDAARRQRASGPSSRPRCQRCPSQHPPSRPAAPRTRGTQRRRSPGAHTPVPGRRYGTGKTPRSASAQAQNRRRAPLGLSGCRRSPCSASYSLPSRRHPVGREGGFAPGSSHLAPAEAATGAALDSCTPAPAAGTCPAGSCAQEPVSRPGSGGPGKAPQPWTPPRRRCSWGIPPARSPRLAARFLGSLHQGRGRSL
mmetsp:Transcript_17174/g.65555  ORF Transcript_17174/g.65555 Transcript_17174/m.65555 type:complete len:200 (+) Transcript_17174:361-960(+)|eukprot:scaffold1638_cov258-Pinguiococcus_pyrenoidosus.AAC.31